MAQATIGALRVTLGMNSAAFSKGIKSANANMAKFAKATAVAIGTATAAMSAAVLSVSKYADEMGKTAQSVGVSVESLSELRHAADMSGASFGDLQTGLRKLAQTMGDALTTPTSEGAKALSSLGVSIRNTDGTLKNSEQVLGDVAQAFSQIEDGALKTDAAMAIFGRSGTSLIPMLNEGRDGLINFGKEARNLGLVISGETFQASQAFNDNLARMGKVFEGIKISLAAGVLPAFKLLSDRLVDGLTNSNALKIATEGLSKIFLGLANAITYAFNNLDVLYDLFKVFVAAKVATYFAAVVGTFLTLARAIRTTGLVMAAFNAVSGIGVKKIMLIGGALALATGNFDALESRVSAFASKVSSMIPDSLKETGKSIMDSLSIDTAGAASSLETYLGVQNDVNNSLQSTAQLAERLGSGGLGKVGTAGAAAAGKAKDAWEGLRGKVKQTTDDMVQKMESAGSSIGSALTGLIDGSKSWLDVIKNIASSLARMALQSFNPTSGVGGFFKGVLGSLFSFDGGGFTGVGSRSGGMDGKGGFPAILHPNETVIDHTKGQMASGSVTGNTYIIDARGADVAAVARLEGVVAKMNRDLPKNVNAINQRKQTRKVTY